MLKVTYCIQSGKPTWKWKTHQLNYIIVEMHFLLNLRTVSYLLIWKLIRRSKPQNNHQKPTQDVGVLEPGLGFLRSSSKPSTMSSAALLKGVVWTGTLRGVSKRMRQVKAYDWNPPERKLQTKPYETLISCIKHFSHPWDLLELFTQVTSASGSMTGTFMGSWHISSSGRLHALLCHVLLE